jgi:thiamine biosynthesis lipoprotein
METPVTLSLQAMATRFELVLHGDDAVRLRAAGEEALQEIERLEAQLSFYRADSEIRWINARAADAPVRVEPRLFALLRQCATLAERTEGAFDVTVGPLMRAWGFVRDTGRVPSPEDIERARAVTGIGHVRFDENDFTVELDRPGVEIDLGAYGKGYACERAVALLRENGVGRALLHGGTSSVCTIGAPPGDTAWRISLGPPLAREDASAIVGLVDDALSVSAVHGKSFTADGHTYGHVVDPRTGEPTRSAAAAAVRGPSAATCEALSTALMVLGPSWLASLEERFPGYAGAVAFEARPSEVEVVSSAQFQYATPRTAE